MKQYDHKEIEKKWQQAWEENQVYRTLDSREKPKKYILDMFPYPSGEGLHVGHPRGYMATDIYSRMMRMKGFNVLHPMGWDGFGLPAENYAIKHKIHPKAAVDENVARFKKQLSLMGVDYDWSREINTTDPEFYKWTQWIFLQMYKKGLAYESYEPINWCPSCQTGLANEDVESDGTCERCGTLVEKKPMRQWVLKITEYADRMLADLDKLPKWPEGVKEAQRNWIGKKEGVVVSHKVEDSDITLDAFSAYPAWLYADTFVVIAPEHPVVLSLVQGTAAEKEVMAFIEKMKGVTEIERGAENKEKEGVFTGKYVIDPLRPDVKMPVWIANFAMMGFGTGIIRCSAHDPRDFAFAQKYSIPLREVVDRVVHNEPVNAHGNTGILKDSGQFSGKEINDFLIEEMIGFFVSERHTVRKTTYRMKDWVFSRQRYWGEPIPVIHCEKCGVVPVPESELPVKLPDVSHYEPAGTGESPLATITDWVNVPCPSCGGTGKRETNTMPQWAGSSWYYLRYLDPHNNESLVDPQKEKYLMPVDVYVGGDHATRHLIYARFWHKFLFDIGSVSTEEPFPRLEFLGFILAPDGRKMSKSKGNVISPDEMIERFGADSFRLYEAFIGPFESTVPWSTDGLVGTRRFIEKIWRYYQKIKSLGEDYRKGILGSQYNDNKLQTKVHQTIKKITEDIETFKFNTAVSGLMIMFNELLKESSPDSSNISSSLTTLIPYKDSLSLLKLVAPFAPHVAEELWYELGEKESIHLVSWPEYDKKLVEETAVTLGIQVNGKVRGEVTIAKDVQESEVQNMVLEMPEIKKWIDGKPIKKFIYVPGRIINVVI